jgi:putative MATE family efflux protein
VTQNIKAPEQHKTKVQAMLTAPILPLLFTMAAPSAIAFLLQSVVSLAEIGFVSQLGTVPLAALALLFPALMLMQMLANGSIGGAVASSVARALGNQDLDCASRIVWHAIFIALCAGGVFFLVFNLAGQTAIAATGVSDDVAAAAFQYGQLLFLGSAVIWLMALLSALYRGMGDMKTPAIVMTAGSLLQIPLSGALILGWFNIPAQGLKGSITALLVVNAISSAALLFGLITHRTVLRPTRHNLLLKSQILRDIFHVGAPASLSPLLTVGIVLVTNSLVGVFGDAALAGYGIVSRIEFLLIPLVFGIGAALTALVGINVGADQHQRAIHIAWLGAVLAASLCGAIGLILALAPELLMNRFTSQPEVWLAGQQYLVVVGPVFAFQGIGFALYFAAQGGGNVTLPVAGALLRFGIAAGVGVYGRYYLSFELHDVYLCLAAAMVTYGLVSMSSLRYGWGSTASKLTRH